MPAQARALQHVDVPVSVPSSPEAPPERPFSEAELEASYVAIAEASDRLRAEFDEHTLDMLRR